MQPYEQNRTAWGTTATTRSQVDVDQGLRAFMLGVYNNMTLGLAVTGLVALGTFMLATTTGVNGRIALTPFGQAIYLSPLKWVVILAPLAFVFFFTFRMEQMTSATARMVFLLFAAVMGVSLSSIFVVFTGQSITQVFFITAAAFGALSLYGYTTKRDLTAMGKFLFMGLIGLILAGVVNMIWPSGTMSFIISAVGVLIFSGLIAYDTQKIKEQYADAWDTGTAEKVAIFGALSLYLDFVNLFQFLMSFMGQEKD